MNLIFLRHGQDDDSRRGGWSSYGLLEEGHRQAKITAAYLCNTYRIGAIFASDLPRTMETAHYAANALQLPIHADPMLREINNGCLAGMPNKEALVKYPGLFFSSLEMDEPYPGGESPREFHQRIKAWFASFVHEHRNDPDDILVVTHGGVIKIIHHLVKELEWTNKVNTVPTGKCSIHVLDTDQMAFVVENQTVWSCGTAASEFAIDFLHEGGI